MFRIESFRGAEILSDVMDDDAMWWNAFFLRLVSELTEKFPLGKGTSDEDQIWNVLDKLKLIVLENE